eukprot:GSMAST32.ASY1.ANO1.1492.1 assembled CDS
MVMMDNNESDGEVSGIIYPPPDVRAIVDKTAQFVARNGVQFESRIAASESGNLKFAFLQKNDPYHAYYKFMVADDKNNDTTEKSSNEIPQSSTTDDTNGPESSSVSTTIDASMSNVPPEEPELIFDPIHSDPELVDVIKLVAQHVAVSGRRFLDQVVVRERLNTEFNFLKTDHKLFPYFTSLIKAYERCVVPTQDLLDSLKNDVTSIDPILRRDQKKIDEEEARAERIMYLSTDWHDFVVVETITFDESDEYDDSNLNSSHSDRTSQNTRKKRKLNVQTDYKPKVQSATVEEQHFVDKTGRRIAVDQSEEVMRIELLDPTWREQRQRSIAKQKITAFATNNQIASNLRRLQTKRGEAESLNKDDESSSKNLGDKLAEIKGYDPMDTSEAANDDDDDEKINSVMNSLGGVVQSNSSNPNPNLRKSHAMSQSILPPPPMTHLNTTNDTIDHKIIPNMPKTIQQNQTIQPPPPSSQSVPVEPKSMPPPQEKWKDPNALISAVEWQKTHTDKILIKIQVPMDENGSMYPTQWGLNGQVIEINANLSETIKQIKLKLSTHLGKMPCNKQQLKSVQFGFLRDNLSLSHYNFTGTIDLVLKPKVRGKRGKR